jgi:hypothetical protein
MHRYLKRYLDGKVEIISAPDEILAKGFPESSGIDYHKLKLTNEALYSITGKKGSQFIANLIVKYYGTNDLVITDATGNVGSDTITFALNFSKVNSIEINPINYDALVNNISVYNLRDKITAYNDDSIKKLQELEQDVIYIDAPWGGSSFKKYKYMKLYLGTHELVDIYKKFKGKAKMFVFKVPPNYDFNYFLSQISNAVHVETYIGSKKKIRFKIIVVRTDSL